ncbi:peptidase U32 family protein [Dethiobacter alkaliphilus]|uniref:Peptidase U32 n=1 Tax=Dethiobacter alkaliphilus AHT 1 TaxID=555088 RepID=C0GKI0_DETAL|nr:U32 family peptidase [Dethiobacter alkaliphilus]EEG76147.1 peptidase U32 [Dethiobacter alkaliphilus AHT 1]
MHKPEILAPAGDLEKLKMAVIYGADAVYLAGKQFGMRAFAGNFTEEEMKTGVDFAHQHGVKVYVTINIFAGNEDIAQLPAYLKTLADTEVDALIVADPGVFALARETVPQLPCHLSTQANTTNWKSARFWQDAGVARIVLARELTLPEIAEIRSHTDLELEVFAHGAMCWAYSGRCYLSHHMEGRSGNRGQCAQACRWKYHLMEEKRPGEYLPVYEDERGTYILNARDLCLIEHIPDLVKAGVNSFKIEGRMKSVYYVATVTRAYRQALDAYLADPDNYTLDPALKDELHKISHRPYSTGFLHGNPGVKGQVPETTAQVASHEFVGVVQSYDALNNRAVVEMRNRFAVGEQLEVAGPKTPSRHFTVKDLRNAEGAPIEEAIRVQEHVSLHMPFAVEEFSLIRRAKSV